MQLARANGRRASGRLVPQRRSGRLLPHRPSGRPAPPDPATTAPARLLNAGAGLLSFSVLADSATEHYRGSFHNKAMWTPLAVSTLTLGASLHGLRDLTPALERRRDRLYAAAALAGLAGTGFHLYNVTRRPGGMGWLNLFYGAPLGAPLALLLAGVLGVASERVRDASPGATPTILGMPAAPVVSAIGAGGLLGTAAEAALLHFRGAYHNPAMLLPVTVPPVTAALLARAAHRPTPASLRTARRALGLTALLGVVGVGLHTFGVHRNMGGWRNWSQNVLNGPPLPAPPSFTGLALAGLAALGLIARRRWGSSGGPAR